MSELHPIGRHRDDAVGDVVFVHGLGGDWWSTWAADARRQETFWPGWLADHLPGANVWSLEYGADPSGWRGAEMSIIEHADNVLELLLTKGLGSRPLAFVAHSLGGLLVKNLLRASREAADEKAHRVAMATRGVAFFGTPNSGALLASLGVRLLAWLGPLGQIARVSPLIHELRAHSPELRRLNQWYRDQVTDRADGLCIRTKVYYEKRGTVLGLLLIVDETSADPGLAGIRPVPVSADHFDICKFAARNDWLYDNARQFLEECLSDELPSPSFPNHTGGVASRAHWGPSLEPALERPFRSAEEQHRDGPTRIHRAPQAVIGRGNTSPLDSTTAEPVRVFISYRHADHSVRNEVRKHLGWLENSDQIRVFDDRDILAGDDWDARIKTELEQARIIILIVTADFMHSSYCTKVELRGALERRAGAGTRVIPIIAEACDWEAMPIFQIAALPKDKANNLKPLNKWRGDKDVALTQIAQQVRQNVERLATANPS